MEAKSYDTTITIVAIVIDVNDFDWCMN